MKTKIKNTSDESFLTMYFGKRHSDTRKEFDQLSNILRRSRTGTLEYLLSYYHQSEKLRREPIIL